GRRVGRIACRVGASVVAGRGPAVGRYARIRFAAVLSGRRGVVFRDIAACDGAGESSRDESNGKEITLGRHRMRPRDRNRYAIHPDAPSPERRAVTSAPFFSTSGALHRTPVAVCGTVHRTWDARDALPRFRFAAEQGARVAVTLRDSGDVLAIAALALV